MRACWQGEFWYRRAKRLSRVTRERKTTMSSVKATTAHCPPPSGKMKSDRHRNSLARCAHFYRSTALILLNTVVLLVLINLALWSARRIWPALVGKGDEISTVLKGAYPHMSAPEIGRLLAETRALTYVYEPFTQFREAPCQGTYVNISSNGFRMTQGQGPWPPSPDHYNVFVFGGSTTLGAGVADGETVPSRLREYLARHFREQVSVYNFGRVAYFSTQERIFLEQLLVAKHRPALAVFIDGLNDNIFRDGRPMYTDSMREMFRRVRLDNGPTDSLAVHAKSLPMGRLARWVLDKWVLPATPPPFLLGENPAQEVVERYLRNKELIESVCSRAGVQSVFIWQPIPVLKCEEKLRPFTRDVGWEPVKQVYQLLEELGQKGRLGTNFLWCADIQQGAQVTLYVDRFHYSAVMTRRFAEAIDRLLIERKLVPAGDAAVGGR
jgi:lysophospholipase L1-like esterase